MNRLTAIGLVSLVAYGLLIASKYTGFVSAAREDRAGHTVSATASPAGDSSVQPANPEPRPKAQFTAAVPPQTYRPSAAAVEFRATRDLRAYADGLASRKVSLTGDERYHLAKALEECQFAMNVSEDLVAYSAKQRRQFIATLPPNDPLNARRISSYDLQDSTQRCARFQGTKISPREIEDLYAAAARQGDARAQARMVVAEGPKNNVGGSNNGNPQPQRAGDDVSRIIELLESQDPEAMLIVGQYLSSSEMAARLRIGPNGEVPEPSAFLGAFSIVACDLGTDCSSFVREHLNACAFGGYCSATSFEELYQNFMASPWSHQQALRYRQIIRNAIDTRNWALLGLIPQPQQQGNTGTPGQ
ncbi:hypothetical protein [Usitatibacter palustris]|uniref:Uncharacterized protein n=1 Tax=Usitatibacter palustris TaxID=2732487 RepID=A0A6M4HBQ3_9PROT|nr:hypothetical protein [Usitatibacter palustris]QJR15397.1 hypothetical protein DSM104440_02216 [Usitatibacter palustris]